MTSKQSSRLIAVGSAADKTFFHTVTQIHRAFKQVVIIDLADLVKHGDVVFSPDSASYFHLGDEKVFLQDDDRIYCRIIDISFNGLSKDLQLKTQTQYKNVLRLLSKFSGRIVNPPLSDFSNQSKFFHQSLVHGLDIKTPQSIVTNCASDARLFVENLSGQVISKGCSAFKTIAKKWDDSDFKRLDTIGNCPILLQEMIVGPDVRVHVIDGKCSAELIASEGVDYRFKKHSGAIAKFKITLPESIVTFCAKLNRIYNTPFLGIDFKIRSSDGEYFFLEANSMPAYHGYDIRANYEISRALRDYLCH